MAYIRATFYFLSFSVLQRFTVEISFGSGKRVGTKCSKGNVVTVCCFNDGNRSVSRLGLSINRVMPLILEVCSISQMKEVIFSS